ncbi:CC_3452 family protein [Erythrobacter alti]|uniref:CC_3452 family protein n=1 Tax=Erythrobacter alti TaxID=1896145 RepID=UPI0030F4031B
MSYLTKLIAVPVLSLAAIAAPLAASSAPQTPVPAPASYFTAELAQPTDENRVIAGGVVFNCEGTACTGPRSRDRELRVCRELRREVGTIASFTVAGEALPESQLARCNG